MNNSLFTDSLAASNIASAQQAYHDVQGLQRLKSLGQSDPDASLDAISQQFESLLVQQMLKSMREANRIWSEDSLFNTQRVEFYQQMLDDQLSVELTRGEGIGLSESIRRQIGQRYAGMIGVAASEDPDKGSLANGELRVLPYAARVASDRIASARIGSVSETESVNAVAGPENTDEASVLPAELYSAENVFVQRIQPYARSAAAKLGVDPQHIVAQAVLETGWGRQVLQNPDGSSSYNLFGIKADARWRGQSVAAVTSEFHDQREIRVNARFRSYPTLQAAFDDYVDFIQGQPRYREALDSGGAYPQQLQRAGYATDPAYADKIEKLASQLFPGSQVAATQLSQRGEGV